MMTPHEQMTLDAALRLTRTTLCYGGKAPEADVVAAIQARRGRCEQLNVRTSAAGGERYEFARAVVDALSKSPTLMLLIGDKLSDGARAVIEEMRVRGAVHVADVPAFVPKWKARGLSAEDQKKFDDEEQARRAEHQKQDEAAMRKLPDDFRLVALSNAKEVEEKTWLAFGMKLAGSQVISNPIWAPRSPYHYKEPPRAE